MTDVKQCEGKKCHSRATEFVGGSNMKKALWLCTPCAEVIRDKMRGNRAE